MWESPVERRKAALKLAVAALVLSAVAAVMIWDPLAGLARSFEVPDALPDAPDAPRWLLFLLGKAKYILLAVIVLAVAAHRASMKESP